MVSAGEGILEDARDLDTTNGFSVKADDSTASTGTSITADRILTTPSTDKVYRWLAEEHVTISPVVGDVEFFGDVPGTQGVLIKTGASTTTTATATAVPNNAPVALNQDVVGTLSATGTLSAAIEILLTGFDGDDDTLTFTLASLAAFGDLSETAGGTALGTVALTGSTVFYDLNSAGASITATGTDVFSFSVNDGTDDSVTNGTVSITFTGP